MAQAAGSERRKGAERLGRWAEFAAAWMLRLKGYRVLERRFRTPSGEIDLIVRRGNLIAAVEVKARSDQAAAAAAVTPHQQTRISNAMAIFLGRRAAYAGLDVRFDAVLIAPWRLPRHVPAAW